MQTRIRTSHTRWSVAVQVALVALIAALASAVPEGQGVRQQLPALAIGSLGPTESFAFYCATCHGRSGAGDGSVASALRTKPPDLRTLAERSGGQFPRERVRAYIMGTGRQVAAHGTGDMPVWGPAFKALDGSDTRAQVRIDGLVDHIASLQVAENGAQLYREHCASCHGTAGRGSGPLSVELRKTPPDLTQFARRNGGMFPAERVRRIIDGRDVPSHGDRDMPVWGATFKRESPDASEAAADARIAALVRYLQSIQERPAE